MIFRHAKAPLAKAGPAVDHQASRPKDNRCSGSTKIAGAPQTAREPAWPDGADIMAVTAGRETIGFIEKRDGVYLALDVDGAVVGSAQTRASAFACVLDVARLRKGSAS